MIGTCLSPSNVITFVFGFVEYVDCHWIDGKYHMFLLTINHIILPVLSGMRTFFFTVNKI